MRLRRALSEQRPSFTTTEALDPREIEKRETQMREIPQSKLQNVTLRF